MSGTSENQLPIVVEVPVAWGDMDAFGHVNNTVYFRWFESARIELFTRVGIGGPVGGGGLGPILARTACDFRVPLTYPDSMRVECGVSAIGGRSFTIAYRVHSRAHAKIAARGDSVVVWFDYGAQKACAIDDDLRARLSALVVDPNLTA